MGPAHVLRICPMAKILSCRFAFGIWVRFARFPGRHASCPALDVRKIPQRPLAAGPNPPFVAVNSSHPGQCPAQRLNLLHRSHFLSPGAALLPSPGPNSLAKCELVGLETTRPTENIEGGNARRADACKGNLALGDRRRFRAQERVASSSERKAAMRCTSREVAGLLMVPAESPWRSAFKPVRDFPAAVEARGSSDRWLCLQRFWRPTPFVLLLLLLQRKQRGVNLGR